jgi:hypothetical protein
MAKIGQWGWIRPAADRQDHSPRSVGPSFLQTFRSAHSDTTCRYNATVPLSHEPGSFSVWMINVWSQTEG